MHCAVIKILYNIITPKTDKTLRQMAVVTEPTEIWSDHKSYSS